MREPEKSRIVVGVAPTRDHDAALEYAAAEAERRGSGIRVVVVMHPHWPGPDGLVDVELVGDELVRTDLALLRQCEERLAPWLSGSLPVTTEVCHGAVVPSRVVAPVVAVPDGWHERTSAGPPVVAAIENAALSGQVAEQALTCARRTGSKVNLMRAWSYADDLALDDPLFRTATVEEWEGHLQAELEREFADLVAAYPDVPSQILVVHGQAAYVLARVTALSRLLVIGRHEPRRPHGSHLGPVTRAVLTHGRCPVMVVDARRRTP